MSDAYKLTTEIFAIPYEPGLHVLYSPLKQLLMLCNDGMVDLVGQLREGTFAGINAENIDAMQLLIESGAVNGEDDVLPSTPQHTKWQPTEVTLFLTNSCNLRCTYCYASAGEYSGTMDAETATRAVELVANNARQLQRDGFRVSFHGGGEPTVAWPVMVTAVECAERIAAENQLDVSLNLATNGVLPSWKVDWLVRHIHEFSISYDGPGYLQDRHRPTAQGKGSAQTVEATFRHLDSHGAKYGIRATITRESVHHLAEIVDYTLQRYHPGVFHVEPMFRQGRARDKGLGPPEATVFIEAFREAAAIAENYGVELYYSGARSETMTATFCGVPEGSFNVTPEGLLTSCFEVCHPEDQLADAFFYGAFEAHGKKDAKDSFALPVLGTVSPSRGPVGGTAVGGFQVNDEKLDELAGHTVRERPECENCYCKWHCAGDCIAKNMISDSHSEENLKSARCTINQALTLDQLVHRLRRDSRVMRQIDGSNNSRC